MKVKAVSRTITASVKRIPTHEDKRAYTRFDYVAKPSVPDKDVHIASMCTVATEEVKEEAHACLWAFQAVYPDTPMLLFCDAPTAEYFQRATLNHLEIAVVAFSQPGEVVLHNSYHRSDAILKKMDVMSEAIRRWGNTLFLDCDVILLSELSELKDCEVALSHNFTVTIDDISHSDRYGIFNAGMVWSKNPTFPEWWRTVYLCADEGLFYEQSYLNYVPKLFRTSYISPDHNYGFWRGDLGNRRIKSLHCHLSTRLDHTFTPFLRDHIRKLRYAGWRYMGDHMPPEFIWKLKRILGFPTKLLFCHYGKAGGVYTNAVMHKLTKGFEQLNSWTVHNLDKKKLERDWTEREMLFFLNTRDAKEGCYIHQHHVSITENMIHAANKHEWLSFMFVRNPKRTILSAYYYMLKYVAKNKRNVIFPEESENRVWTLSDFWNKLLQPEHRWLWSVPPWSSSITVLKEFSTEALNDFVYTYFGCDAPVLPPMNTSESKSLEEVLLSGELHQHQVDALEATEEYQAYTSLAL